MTIFYSLTTGQDGPLESAPEQGREKWGETVKSLVPEGFSGTFGVFEIPPKEEMADDEFFPDEPFPVLSFNCYGKSAHPNVSFGSRPLERLALDIREMISFLLERLEVESLFLLGFSLGASLSILSSHRSPGGIRALVGVGADVCIPESELVLQNFLDGEAVHRNHLSAQKDLKWIGDPPYLNSSPFMIRAKWATEFGGIHRKERYGALLRKNLYRLFSSSEYSLKEAIRALGAIASVQEALLPEMKALDLFRQAPFLKVPVFLFQGRYDAVAPSVLTQHYFDLLEAPHGKDLLWFASSAHMPHYEEPDRFAGFLKEVRIRTEEGKSIVPEVIDR